MFFEWESVGASTRLHFRAFKHQLRVWLLVQWSLSVLCSSVFSALMTGLSSDVLRSLDGGFMLHIPFVKVQLKWHETFQTLKSQPTRLSKRFHSINSECFQIGVLSHKWGDGLGFMWVSSFCSLTWFYRSVFPAALLHLLTSLQHLGFLFILILLGS